MSTHNICFSGELRKTINFWLNRASYLQLWEKEKEWGRVGGWGRWGEGGEGKGGSGWKVNSKTLTKLHDYKDLSGSFFFEYADCRIKRLVDTVFTECIRTDMPEQTV